ncbi:MAG: YbhN family protein [Cyanobacteria bacterium P01_D01_bin.56]
MVKRFLRWLLFGGILFFLAKTLKDHWQEVRMLQMTGVTWALLTIALGITLIAHIWSGWVWHWILRTIGQPRDGRWSAVVYLKTNIAKYLPGNVWHFYGRVRALQATGSSTGAAIVGVVLEPILMAAAALGLAAISFSLTVADDWRLLLPCVAALVAMLVAIHPRFLNPVLRKLGIAKAKAQGLTVITSTLRLQFYPWRSLLGELGFVVLRGMGFMMTVVALQALEPSQFFPVLGAFSVAWLLGLLVPGAPGGVGVFEAVAIALLGSQIPSGLLISSVALYRLISTLAEALGAGLIWLEERITDFMTPVRKTKQPILLPPPKDETSQSDDESADLLDTVAPEKSVVSYAINPKQELLSEDIESLRNNTASTPEGHESPDVSDSESVAPEDVSSSAPVLPSFMSQSSIREGEPTTQSFAPRKKR